MLLENYRYKDILIFHYDKVLSTSDLIREFDREQKKVVIWADTQLRGKGRKKRDWISPYGGLWFTLSFSPEEFSKKYLPYIVKLSAISLIDLLDSCKIQALIKPPNDIFVDRKKIAGILIDTKIKSDTIKTIYIGIGLNVNNTMKDAPKEIRETAITMYDIKKKTWSLKELLHELLDRLFFWFDMLFLSCEEIDTIYTEKIIKD